MSRREQLRLYKSVCREALRAANVWNLSQETVAAIKDATVMANAECANVAISYGNGLIRAQVTGVFAYASALLCGCCVCDAARDIIPEAWEKGIGINPIMILRISKHREGGAQNVDLDIIRAEREEGKAVAQ